MLLQSKSDLKSWLVKAGDKKKGFSLESKKRMMMQKVIGNNPVFVYIAFARDCVMYQKWPETDLWIKMIVWGIASFLIGYYVFSKKENNVMQKI